MEEENKNILTENNTNNNPQLVPGKSNKGLIVVLILIILLLAGGLVYALFFNKENDKKGNDNPNPTPTVEPTIVPTIDPTIEPTVNPTDEPIEEGDNSLYVYVSDFGGGYKQIFDSYTTDATKVEIKVQSKDAKFVSSDYDNTGNFFLYDDNGLKLYDIKNKKSTKLNINGEYEKCYINMSYDKKSVLGISYTDSNGMETFYNVKNNKEMYKKKYKVPEDFHFTNVNDLYLSLSTEKVSYLLSADTEKEIMSYKNDADDYYKHSYFGYKVNGKYVYSLEKCYDDGCELKELYNDQMKKFFSGETSSETGLSLYNNVIYVNDNNIVKKFNENGALQSSKEFKVFNQLIRNYVVYVKDGMLTLENYDDSNEKKEIIKLADKWSIDTFASGYYTSNDLKELKESNKKEGLYIVIDYSGKDSKGNYGMEYCYTTNKQIIEYPIKTEFGGRAKPVLYLYPEKETNVTVKFEKPDLLTTTYPKYINSWNVTVKPNGDMIDSDGKYYYALYWDEKRYNEVDFSEGFYVLGKDAIKFLEEKLTIIGLNDKERNEFIMYWLPIMEANGKNLVYFELTKERESENKLIIEPKPDSLLRVCIHIKKVNKKVDIKEEKLETFKRVGFTAVEWGGMTY